MMTVNEFFSCSVSNKMLRSHDPVGVSRIRSSRLTPGRCFDRIDELRSTPSRRERVLQVCRSTVPASALYRNTHELECWAAVFSM